ncbi:hypothetical protein HK100_008761, partial [Physocladia obscura]
FFTLETLQLEIFQAQLEKLPGPEHSDYKRLLQDISFYDDSENVDLETIPPPKHWTSDHPVKSVSTTTNRNSSSTFGYYSWISEINDVSLFREEIDVPILNTVPHPPIPPPFSQTTYFCSICNAYKGSFNFFSSQQAEPRDSIRTCNMHSFRSLTNFRDQNVKLVEIVILNWPFLFIVASADIAPGQEILLNYEGEWVTRWCERENYLIYKNLLHRFSQETSDQRMKTILTQRIKIDVADLEEQVKETAGKKEVVNLSAVSKLTKSLKTIQSALTLVSGAGDILAGTQSNKTNHFEMGEHLQKDVVEDCIATQDPITWTRLEAIWVARQKIDEEKQKKQECKDSERILESSNSGSSSSSTSVDIKRRKLHKY